MLNHRQFRKLGHVVRMADCQTAPLRAVRSTITRPQESWWTEDMPVAPCQVDPKKVKHSILQAGGSLSLAVGKVTLTKCGIQSRH